MRQISYEFNSASLEPWRLAARVGAALFNHPYNPLAYTLAGQSASAACRALERFIGTYSPNGFDLESARQFQSDLAAGMPVVSAKILPFAPRVRRAG